MLKSGCAIKALAHKTRTRLERAIAIRLVIGRRTNPPPGHQVIWRGLAQLITRCEGFLLGKASCPAHLILKRQSRLRRLKLKGLLPKTRDAGERCVPPGRPRRVKIRR